LGALGLVYAIATLPLLAWLVHGWIAEVRGRALLQRDLQEEAQRRTTAEAEAKGAQDAAERLRAVVALTSGQLDDLRAQLLESAGDDPARARAALLAAGLLSPDEGGASAADRGRGGELPAGTATATGTGPTGGIIERLP